MATNNLYPAVAVNRMLWAAIEAENIMTKADYSGLIPIIPIEESPDFMTIIDQQGGIGSRPYIVYTWSKVPGNENWFIKSHEIAYAIRSTDDDKTRRLLNLFENLFQDYDAAAQRLNAFNYSPAGREAHTIYDFKWIHLTTLGGPMPSEEENGPNESIIGLRVGYTGG
jgi:hypothetical protein